MRPEITGAIELPLARAWYALVCRHRLVKTRHGIDGWELDIFEGPLAGIVILERELRSADELPPSLPAWVLEAVDVTDILTNGRLAKLATRIRKRGGNARMEVERIIAKRQGTSS